MNIRQQKYKANRIAGMNAYRAAIDAGYAHATAIAAYKNIEKRINFDDVLVKAGLTDDLLAKKIVEGLEAEKSIGAVILVQKDGKVVKADDEGGIMIPDPQVRHKYIETSLKLKGRLKDTTPNGKGQDVHIIIVRENGGDSSQGQEGRLPRSLSIQQV